MSLIDVANTKLYPNEAKRLEGPNHDDTNIRAGENVGLESVGDGDARSRRLERSRKIDSVGTGGILDFSHLALMLGDIR